MSIDRFSESSQTHDVEIAITGLPSDERDFVEARLRKKGHDPAQVDTVYYSWEPGVWMSIEVDDPKPGGVRREIYEESLKGEFSAEQLIPDVVLRKAGYRESTVMGIDKFLEGEIEAEDMLEASELEN